MASSPQAPMLHEVWRRRPTDPLGYPHSSSTVRHRADQARSRPRPRQRIDSWPTYVLSPLTHRRGSCSTSHRSNQPTQGNTNYRDDRKIFTDAKRRFADHNMECLDHLYRHLTPASHTSIKTLADYPAYQLLPIGAQSYAFYVMARSIHSTGNAATKLHRTRQYMNIS